MGQLQLDELEIADAAALETVNMALSNKNFQMILYPIAQERGYMQEEGIDLRVILARAELTVALHQPGTWHAVDIEEDQQVRAGAEGALGAGVGARRGGGGSGLVSFA